MFHNSWKNEAHIWSRFTAAPAWSYINPRSKLRYIICLLWRNWLRAETSDMETAFYILMSGSTDTECNAEQNYSAKNIKEKFFWGTSTLVGT